MTNPGPHEPGGAAPDGSRNSVERLIDEIVDDTFPASDAPAWGVVASRLERSRAANPAAGDTSRSPPEPSPPPTSAGSDRR